jgi:hypothetical protein
MYSNTIPRGIPYSKEDRSSSGIQSCGARLKIQIVQVFKIVRVRDKGYTENIDIDKVYC